MPYEKLGKLPRDWLEAGFFRSRSVRSGQGPLDLKVDLGGRIGKIEFRGPRFPGSCAAPFLAALTCHVAHEEAPPDLAGWAESVMIETFGIDCRGVELPTFCDEFLPTAFGSVSLESIGDMLGWKAQHGRIEAVLDDLSAVRVLELDIERQAEVNSPILVAELDGSRRSFRFVLHPHLAYAALGDCSVMYFSRTITKGGQFPVMIPMDDNRNLPDATLKLIHIAICSEHLGFSNVDAISLEKISGALYGNAAGTPSIRKTRERFILKSLDRIAEETRLCFGFSPQFPGMILVMNNARSLFATRETPLPPDRPRLELIKEKDPVT
jgi:hypothetical protein